MPVPRELCSLLLFSHIACLRVSEPALPTVQPLPSKTSSNSAPAIPRRLPHAKNTHHRRRPKLDLLRERHHGPTPQSLVFVSTLLPRYLTPVDITSISTTAVDVAPGLWTAASFYASGSDLLAAITTADRCEGEDWE